MKYEVVPSAKFKKGVKRAEKRGVDIGKIFNVIRMLADGQTLPPEYKDHRLFGNYAGTRECHIYPDWLLIYEYIDSELVLHLLDTGTHSDLFNK